MRHPDQHLCGYSKKMQSPFGDGGSYTFPLPGKDRTPETIAEERKNIATRYGIMMGVEFGIYSLTYLCSPGYITPLFYYPMPRLIFFLLTFWQISAITAHWYLAPLNKYSKAALTLACILFIVPGIFFPMLGPATIGIMNALGPIFSSSQ